ncbi:MAG: glycosyltransferase family 4 protein, partial [Promethearchaeota archaeon]
PILIIGEGELSNKLKQAKKDLNITYILRIPNREIHKYFLQSKIFVIPSLTEGLPTVILEAMAYGAAVVATNVGGIPELIKHNQNGFLYRPKDNKKAIEYITKLIENNGLAEKFRENSLNIIKKQFSCNKIALKYLALYRKLIMEKRQFTSL